MTEALPATQDASDAKLLNLIRAGDAAAFGVLIQRHEEAARRLADELTGTPGDAGDLVTETFALILAITQRGGGPTDAFRPYVLTALRRVQANRLRYAENLPPSDDRLLLDPGAPFIDPDLPDAASLANERLVRGFRSLPERWSAVLWHTEVERAVIWKVTPIFGLTRSGVAALQRRAKAGLRQACLQLYQARLPRADCSPVVEQLGPFIRDSLSVRDTSRVSAHLADCAECSAVCAELADISTALRATVAPAILGTAAAAYLAESADAAEVAAGEVADKAAPAGQAADAALAGPAALTAVAPAAAGGGTGSAEAEGAAALTAASAGTATAAGPASTTGPANGVGIANGAGARWAQWAARRSRWLAGTAAAAVVLAAVAVAVTLTGHGAAARPDAQRQSLPVSVITPTISPSPSPSAPRPRRHKKAAADPAKSAVAAAVTPAAAAAPGPDVQLAASISVAPPGQHRWGYLASFAVSDTGSAGTGELTVSITLPSGSQVFGGGDHRGGPGGPGGWSCQPAGSGATCQHPAIAAGGQAPGVLFFAMPGSGGCGQPAQLTATSGSVSASGESAGLQC